MAAPVADRAFVDPLVTVRPTFEAAIEHIIEAVEGRGMRAGDRLPNEDQLAVQLGISRPTLRQALRVLERARVLSIKKGAAGGIVLTTDLIPVDRVSSSVRLENESVIEILRARRILEPCVTLAATVAATPTDLELMQRSLDLLWAEGDSPEGVRRADAMFHRAVDRACHNRPLQAAMRSVTHGMTPIRHAYAATSARSIGQVLDVHGRQLDAMRRRDIPAVGAVVDEHLKLLERVVARQFGKTTKELFGDIPALWC